MLRLFYDNHKTEEITPNGDRRNDRPLNHPGSVEVQSQAVGNSAGGLVAVV
jgi:hypothetical protein